jgi:ligand-binding SRPBCC domain-containing protein
MLFIKETLIHAPAERVFAFHERPDVLALLMPPWETARIISPARISELGSRTIIDAKIIGPFTGRWIAEHTAYEPPRMFEDTQVAGPFRSWRHRHIITQNKDGAILRDEIDYEPPLGLIGRIFASRLIERRLRRLFDYRHRITAQHCELENTGV